MTTNKNKNTLYYAIYILSGISFKNNKLNIAVNKILEYKYKEINLVVINGKILKGLFVHLN